MNNTFPELTRSTPSSRTLWISRLACWLLPSPRCCRRRPGQPATRVAMATPQSSCTEASEVQFPAFPQAENLIPFVVSATADSKFMIDGESLSVTPRSRRLLHPGNRKFCRRAQRQLRSDPLRHRRAPCLRLWSLRWHLVQSPWRSVATNRGKNSQPAACGTFWRVFLHPRDQPARCRRRTPNSPSGGNRAAAIGPSAH
jgi:hypothetical protein